MVHFENKQEIFDKVSEHLLKQSRRSMNERGCCLYRGLDNTMCAIGCLIPDEYYNSKLESNSIEYNCSNDEFIGKLFETTKLSFLTSLQVVHDFSDIEDWKEELNSVAEEFNLLPYPRN